jgi:DNA-directed RNA polymerase subunit L
MNIEIVKESKDEIELKIDNLTVAEILRSYLYKNGAEFAAWRREHPSKPLILKIKGPNAKKNVAETIAAIKKDCNKIAALVKK